jgi:hypothetical protein
LLAFKARAPPSKRLAAIVCGLSTLLLKRPLKKDISELFIIIKATYN